MSKKIKVLVIDDSALIRRMLTNILNSARDIEVVGTAGDPYIARRKIKQLNPDVLTLDIEMPRMDGLAFLNNLMRLHPMPVVMVSALTQKGADITLQALEGGAIDFICKPQVDIVQTFDSYAEEIISKIRIASKAQVQHTQARHFIKKPPQTLSHPVSQLLKISPKYSADTIISDVQKYRHFRTTEKIIAIGASTGGTQAIKRILVDMPPNTPGIVISQHIPAMFSRSFAEHMNKVSPMSVCEAEDGQIILPGHVYIAPGSHHLLVVRDGARYVCRLNQGNPVNRHRPSVDVLFRSVAQNVGPNAIGVILTGMGDDGARGMKEMYDAGTVTIAQDENSSVVWGMPCEAIKLGGVNYVLSLDIMADKILMLVDMRMQQNR
jgi:two-component system chemotaxis response regulator CheB